MKIGDFVIHISFSSKFIGLAIDLRSPSEWTTYPEIQVFWFMGKHPQYIWHRKNNVFKAYED